MLSEDIWAVLDKIATVSSRLQDTHWVIGSSALVLAGVHLNHVADVDLLTSPRDVEILKVIWKDAFVPSYQPEKESRFRSHFALFRFGNTSLEVMGDLEVKISGQWQQLVVGDCQTIDIGGGSVKIPSLEEQKRILRLFGRPKDLLKIAQIENHYRLLS
jgi:hypothetical protein